VFNEVVKAKLSKCFSFLKNNSDHAGNPPMLQYFIPPVMIIVIKYQKGKKKINTKNKRIKKQTILSFFLIFTGRISNQIY
jgi:hypothetical protein